MSKVKKFLHDYGSMILLSVAMAFILLGIGRGEPAVVLKKATKVCLECIGIG